MNKKLLPCPFCGGEAEIKNLEGEVVYVRYKDCMCTGKAFGEYCFEDEKAEAVSKAIAVWNRRVPNNIHIHNNL